MPEKKAIVVERRELFQIIYRKIFSGHQIAVDLCGGPGCLPCMKNQHKSCPANSPCTDFLLLEQNITPRSGLSILASLDSMGCKIPLSRRALISAHWLESEIEKAQQIPVKVFYKSEAKSRLDEWLTEGKEK